MPSAPPLPLTSEELAHFCRQHDISYLGLFGSAARGAATPDSDIDLLVRFSQRKGLLDQVRIERQLSEALGRPVDLLTEAALSPLLRDRILENVVELYREGS
jgi:predicted nucleotidyltransferase